MAAPPPPPRALCPDGCIHGTAEVEASEPNQVSVELAQTGLESPVVIVTIRMHATAITCPGGAAAE